MLYTLILAALPRFSASALARVSGGLIFPRSLSREVSDYASLVEACRDEIERALIAFATSKTPAVRKAMESELGVKTAYLNSIANMSTLDKSPSVIVANVAFVPIADLSIYTNRIRQARNRLTPTEYSNGAISDLLKIITPADLNEFRFLATTVV